MKIEELNSLAFSLRLKVLTMIARAKTGDAATSLATLEVLLALYLGEDNTHRILNVDPRRPKSSEREYVVVSNAGIAPACCACLAQAGFFEVSELDFYGMERALLRA